MRKVILTERCPACGSLRTGPVREDTSVTYREFARRAAKQIESGSLVYYVRSERYREYYLPMKVNAHCFSCGRDFRSEEKAERLSRAEYAEYREDMLLNEMQAGIYNKGKLKRAVGKLKLGIRQLLPF